jgi:hypothetical protein
MSTPTIQMSNEIRSANSTRTWAKAEILKRLRQIQSILLECEELHPDVFTGISDQANKLIIDAHDIRLIMDQAFWTAAAVACRDLGDADPQGDSHTL